MILSFCLFYNFTLVDELFANDSQIFQNCTFASACGNSALSFPIIFIDNFKVTSVVFFDADLKVAN